MPLSETEVREALRNVKYPGFNRDIVSFGLVKSVNIDNGQIRVQLALATNDPNVPATIKSNAEQVLHGIAGVQSAKVLIDIHAPPAGAGTGVGAVHIPGVKHVIAVNLADGTGAKLPSPPVDARLKSVTTFSDALAQGRALVRAFPRTRISAFARLR